MQTTRLKVILEERAAASMRGAIEVSEGELVRRMTLAEAQAEAIKSGRQSATYMALTELFGQQHVVCREIRDEIRRNDVGESTAPPRSQRAPAWQSNRVGSTSPDSGGGGVEDESGPWKVWVKQCNEARYNRARPSSAASDRSDSSSQSRKRSFEGHGADWDQGKRAHRDQPASWDSKSADAWPPWSDVVSTGKSGEGPVNPWQRNSSAATHGGSWSRSYSSGWGGDEGAGSSPSWGWRSGQQNVGL